MSQPNYENLSWRDFGELLDKALFRLTDHTKSLTRENLTVDKGQEFMMLCNEVALLLVAQMKKNEKMLQSVTNLKAHLDSLC
jgi:hypothetical protein